MPGEIPLEVLEIEPMASGRRSLRLTRKVAWEDFAEYGESLVRALGGTILDRVDSPIERMWTVQIGTGRFWLALDDFGLGVCLDACDVAADQQIEGVRALLLERAGA